MTRLILQALAFASLSGLLLFVGALRLDQSVNGRVVSLGVIVALAGLLTGLALALLQGWRRKRLAAALAFILVPLSVLALSALFYGFYDRVVLGNLEEGSVADHGLLHVMFWSIGSAGYLFLLFGLRVLLPFALPVLAVAGAVLVSVT
jgi:hypothetical protein